MVITDEERKKLCVDLRDPWVFDQSELASLAAIAADEIERLAEERDQLALGAPPHPDASTGLIEAAEIADKSAKYHQQQYNLVNTVKQQLISSSKAMVAEEIAKNIRARVVNRNAK